MQYSSMCQETHSREFQPLPPDKNLLWLTGKKTERKPAFTHFVIVEQSIIIHPDKPLLFRFAINGDLYLTSINQGGSCECKNNPARTSSE